MEIGASCNDDEPTASRSSGKGRQARAGKPQEAGDSPVESHLEVRRRLAQLADRALREAGGMAGPGVKEAGGTSASARERLDRIRRRIETKYYDRPDVKDELAGRLADDLKRENGETAEN